MKPLWFSRVRYSVGNFVTQLRWHPFSESPHRRYDDMLVLVSDGIGVGVAHLRWSPDFSTFSVVDRGRLFDEPAWWKPLPEPPTPTKRGKR